MRHIILAALGAIAALPVTFRSNDAAAALYTFGITAAFSAGVFYAQSKALEKHTAEHFERFRAQLHDVSRGVAALTGRFALLRASFEGWRGRADATVEAYDRRILALEQHREQQQQRVTSQESAA